MQTPRENSWDIWEERTGGTADFSKITRKVKTYWPLCILCAGIISGIALIYLYKTNPIYNVKAAILIQDRDKKSSSTGGIISSLQDIGLMGSSDNVYNEQTIITSYPLIEDVVNNLQLSLQFFTKENLRDIPLYKENIPFKADIISFNPANSGGTANDNQDYKIVWNDSDNYTIYSETQSWKGIWNNPMILPFGKILLQKTEKTADWPKEKVITFTARPVSEIVDRLTANLKAEVPNRQTNIINLTLQTANPRMGVDVLNALISSYQFLTVSDNNKLNDSTLKFINQRLSIVGDELDSIETEIQHFKQKNQLANLSKQSDALVDNLSQQDKTLNAQMVQLSMANSLIEYVEAGRDNPRVIPASLIVNDNTLTQTIENYNRLLSTRDRLELSVTKENPLFQNVQDQLADLQKSIRSGLQSVKHTLESGIAQMQRQNSSLNGTLHEAPSVEKEFGNFSRQQAIKRDLYVFLLQRREESLLAKSSTLANSRIVSPARTSRDPVKPKRGLILLSSVLIGILLPFGYDRASVLFSTKIRTKEDVSSLTSLPIIGEIGHNKEEQSAVVANRPWNLISEQFRAMRTNIQFLLPNTDDKVILITSLESGEGKSFISANLAAIFGMTDKKIVLLEMDLRKPKLIAGLGLKPTKGFTQYVIGKAEIEEIIIPSGIDKNVFVVPAGIIPPNPAELILNNRTEILFKYLRKEFDLIIIDTAPNIVTEPQLLARYADLTLYVLRINQSPKDQLKQINDPASPYKFPRVNLVINGIKAKRYGGNYYGYGHYGPKSYCSENRKKLNPHFEKRLATKKS